MMFENILYETDGPIATLTINRPDKRNAVNNATVEEIDQAWARSQDSRCGSPVSCINLLLDRTNRPYVIEEMVNMSDHAGLETCVPGHFRTERISAPAKHLFFRKNRTFEMWRLTIDLPQSYEHPALP